MAQQGQWLQRVQGHSSGEEWRDVSGGCEEQSCTCKAIRAWSGDLDGLPGKGRTQADEPQAVEEEAAVLGSR